MSNLNPYPIDLLEFRAWLLAQSPDAVVGTACSDESCPLASFLNTQYAGSSFLVHTVDYSRPMDDISVTGCQGDPSFALPACAQEFVYQVDAFADFCGDVPVLRCVALNCLAFACGGVPGPNWEVLA